MVTYNGVSLPNTRGVYTYSLVDVAGVVLANNFLSVLNPTTSAVVHVPLEVGFTSYTSTTAQVIGSLCLYRVTTASGGTLVTATDVIKFQSTYPTQRAELRTGNPTVTRVNNTPVLFKSPVISTGGGNSGTVTVQEPSNTAFTLAPGEGVVFNTAAGATGQTWSMAYSWLELTI